MVGFVYSLPGILGGKPTQWSHMLGVVDEFRNEGVGYDLKLLQRERTIAMGLDLIEWTYDPMQAMNAHLNFTKLGVVAQDTARTSTAIRAARCIRATRPIGLRRNGGFASLTWKGESRRAGRTASVMPFRCERTKLVRPSA